MAPVREEEKFNQKYLVSPILYNTVYTKLLGSVTFSGGGGDETGNVVEIVTQCLETGRVQSSLRLKPSTIEWLWFVSFITGEIFDAVKSNTPIFRSGSQLEAFPGLSAPA